MAGSVPALFGQSSPSCCSRLWVLHSRGSEKKTTAGSVGIRLNRTHPSPLKRADMLLHFPESFSSPWREPDWVSLHWTPSIVWEEMSPCLLHPEYISHPDHPPAYPSKASLVSYKNPPVSGLSYCAALFCLS